MFTLYLVLIILIKQFIQLLQYRKQNFKKMPNWDDQFDFQDLDDNKNKPKQVTKANDKKANNYDDEFFDDQEMGKKKEVKSTLPTINSRTSAKLKPSLQQQKNKANPFADKSFGSKDAKENQEYYDEEEVADQYVDNKQPTKNNAKEINKPQIGKSVNNLSKKKSEVSEQYNQEFMQEQVNEPFHQSIKNNQSSKSIPKSHIQKKQKNQTANPPLNKLNQNANKSKPVEEEAADYEDEFENDEYAEDDFEDESKSPVKNIVKKVNEKVDKIQLKSNLQINQVPKLVEQIKNKVPPKTNNLTTVDNIKQKQNPARGQSLVPPKPPGGDKKNARQAVASNNNIHKLQSKSVSKPLKRSNSRQSIRSNGQNTVKASRISQKNQSEYFPNKHIDMVAKSFPHDEDRLTLLSQIEINKTNEKMRAMIRKFNEELNELINKNMLLLKNKSLQKNQSVQEKIRELQIQKKSGDTAIQVMEKDFDKLHGRQGQLKEQEYQLILQRQIQEKKNQIKQSTKEITVMKRQVDSKGKKLSIKEVEQRNAQNIHHLKTNLIQTKKDEQKGDQRIQKLTSAHEELETKISDMDYKLDELVSQAKEKGVNIENTDQIQKKFEDLKSKLQNIKNFNKKSESLNNTKIDILNHQNEQVRITIRNISSQISNIFGSIDHSQSQAIKLIQKAKQKTGINPLFAESLDKLQKQIEQSRVANTQYYDARSQVKSRRSDSTKNRSHKGSVQENGEKSMPLRVTQSQNRLIENEEPSIVKPKFLKKKPGDQPKLDIENKSQVNERVWINEEQPKQKTPKNDQNRRSVEEISKKDTPKNISQAVTVEDEKKEKSKPFMLKKNKTGDAKPQIIQENLREKIPLTSGAQKIGIQSNLVNEAIARQEVKKQESNNINLAPRMMKFGRKKNNDEPSSQNNVAISESIGEKKQEIKSLALDKKQVPKIGIPQAPNQQQEGQKPIIVPKRFNLRNKAQKKDDSYTPSIQKDNSYVSSVQQSTKMVQKAQSPKIQPKEQYKPKIDFKNQEYKIKQEIPVKKEPEKPIQEPEIKPRFNLKLRDRMNKNNEQENSYASNIAGLNKNLNGDLNIQNITKKNEIQVQSKFNAPKNQFIAATQLNSANDKQPASNNAFNPYAPKIEPSNNSQNRKFQVSKEIPLSKVQKMAPVPPTNNPYASKFQIGDNEVGLSEAPKRERGPLKKNKISTNVPKQPFNIYAQADDMTNEVKQIGATKTVNQNVYESVNSKSNPKNEELNINEMLGIKKEAKKNDFDDLLGDIGGINAKNKKKNNDFFSDLQF